jgi:flagellin
LTVDTALNTVNAELGAIGGQANRLSTKEANLTTAITNTEAAKSRILDADIAKEQIAVVKLQILQQTATAQLAQANASPQVFLSLFR